MKKKAKKLSQIEWKKQFENEFIDPVSALNGHPLFLQFISYYQEQEAIDRLCPGGWRGDVWIPIPSKRLTELRKKATSKYPSKSFAAKEYGIKGNEYYRIRDLAMEFERNLK